MLGELDVLDCLPVRAQMRRMKSEVAMIQTVEAVIDEHGRVRLLEPVELPTPRRALVTILEDELLASGYETALLSEEALAEEWNRPEEDEAWSHLQQGR